MRKLGLAIMIAVGVLPLVTEAQVPIPGAPKQVTAFVDVNVVPMDRERVLSHQTVLVQDGRITALGPATKVKVPAGAVRIDGRGNYLIPGLADMHTHLVYGFYLGAESGTLRSRMSHDVMAEQLLFLWLANGVTTIRNLDYRVDRETGLRSAALLKLRARAAAGEILSPRIYTSGTWAHRDFYEQSIAPDSVATYVAAYKAAGFDFLKLRDEPDSVYDVLGPVARRAGIPIVGHTSSLDRAIQVGYTSIEHLKGYVSKIKFDIQSPDSAALKSVPAHMRESMYKWIPRDTTTWEPMIRSLAATTKRAGIWNCPTQAWTDVWGKADNLAILRRLIKALQDVDAGLLLGTDAPGARRNGQLVGVHDELEALVQAGLTPYQALATGTRNVAQYFGTLDSTGTVAVGKRADLILLRANPLQGISATREPMGVLLGGRWLPRAELDRRVAAIQAAIAPNP